VRWVLLTTLAWALLPVGSARADEDGYETVGDVLAIALPLAAGTTAGVKRDWHGLGQWAISWGSSSTVVAVTKEIIPKQRPNEGGTSSFPSGHAASAFTGAAFFQTRYGWKWGLPAYAGAIYTGWSRIHASKHYADDVLAGMSVALLFNWATVRRYPGTYFPKPVQTAQGYALQFDWPTGEDAWFAGTDGTAPDDPDRIRWRYEWEFGPAWREQNDVRAPNPGGDPISIDEMDDNQNPTYYSNVTIEATWRRHQFAVVLSPFELRDRGTFSSPKSFDGVTLPADTSTRVGYLAYEVSVRWRYDVFGEESRWILKPGLLLSVFDTSVTFLADSGETAKVEETVFTAQAHLTAGIRVTKDWHLLFEVNYADVGDAAALNAAAFVRWYFAGQWDLGIGYRYWNAEVDTAKIANTLEQGRLAIVFGFSW